MIAQQAGQRERRLARFLSSMSLAAAALPWALGGNQQVRWRRLAGNCD